MLLKALLCFTAGLAAGADFEVSRSVLSTRALSELRDVVQGGAPFVKASKEIAGLFSVAAGHAVPAKVARGSVKEHQDRFSGSRAVEGLVSVLYLGHGSGEDKFALRDTRTGAESTIDLDEPGILIKYKNAFFTHRVDAHPSSERVLLGPASIKDGLLTAVGGGCRNTFDTYSCDTASGRSEYTCSKQETIGRGDGSNCRLKSCCTSHEDCEEWVPPNWSSRVEELVECVPCTGDSDSVSSSSSDSVSEGPRRNLRSPLFGSLDKNCAGPLEDVPLGECAAARAANPGPCSPDLDPKYCVDFDGLCEGPPSDKACLVGQADNGRRLAEGADAIYQVVATKEPSAQPSAVSDSLFPSRAQPDPGRRPSGTPSGQPSGAPSGQPSSRPSGMPSKAPSSEPGIKGYCQCIYGFNGRECQTPK